MGLEGDETADSAYKTPGGEVLIGLVQNSNSDSGDGSINIDGVVLLVGKLF